MAIGEIVEAAPASTTADSALLVDVVRSVLGRCGGYRWTVNPTDAWCYVRPPDGHLRAHGWKLHLSATPLSAPLVLARAAEVLVKAGCTFKFGTDLGRVAELVSPWYDRGGGGKFITVYPKDDGQFRSLAEELHEVTARLPGPGILSDRRLRAGSLVHYRYGEFGGDTPEFTDDGTFKRRMIGPDGTAVTDKRHAWFAPPPWACSPFPNVPVAADQAPESMLLDGRFRVFRAIRHANKGGVYRAVDERNGSEVVIKQARAHVDSRLDGTDVRDRLRQEAQTLEVLAPLRVAPALVRLFEEQQDLFLVEEQVPGSTLVERVARQRRDGLWSADSAVDLARRLVSLIRQVHENGFVVRDLKSTNVMVSDDDVLHLVDVEYVARQGVAMGAVGTTGFMAPEVRGPGGRTLTFEPSADCYSLGATLFNMSTLLPPSWLESGRAADRAEVVARIAVSHPALTWLVEPILGLTEPDPQLRWSIKEAEEYLDRAADGGRAPGPAAYPSTRADLQRTITERLAELLRDMTPDRRELWVQKRHPEERDTCSAWNGAAGVLGMLVRAAAARPEDSRLRDAVRTTAAWIDRRLFDVPRLLPGLAFGRAGTAWALHDAGAFLGDAALQERAVELADRLPTRWPIADVTHGLSGAGTALLHLWWSTGEPRLLRRALDCADAVVAAADRSGEDWHWPIPTDVNSEIAGSNSYGYAHGVAGTGAFLLSAAHAAEQDAPGSGERFLRAAVGAGETLVRAASTTPTGGTTWPATVGGGSSLDGMYWCNGAGGIGSFLIRLWATTFDRRFAELAEGAAVTVVEDPWQHPAGACCGLTGAGHFLLDMTEWTGVDRYREQARDIADVICLQPAGQGHDHQAGTAGLLTLMLRLQHGGPSPWTAPATRNPPGSGR